MYNESIAMLRAFIHMMAAVGLRDILSVPNVQQLSEDEIVIKVACMGHYDPLIGTPTPLYTRLANVCVDFIVRGQFGACGLDQVYDGIFFYDMYPIVLEKADPLTGRRYTRAELKTQFERKIRAKGLDPDDVLRKYDAVIEKVLQEADIQDVPRFAYGEAAFDHLQERGVADVYHIMHPEAMKSLSHGNASAIVEAMDDDKDLPTLCWNFPGLELCETSNASSSVMMSILTGEEQDVKYYTQLYEGEAEAIEYLRGLQSEAGKEAWLRLSHSGKVQVLVARGQIDAASFQTGFGFDIGDTARLDALSDEDFEASKSKATKACFAALPRRTQIEIRMRLGHFDAASFQTGFGFRVEDTVALDALSEDDFAEKTAAACAALSRRKKIDRLVRLGTLDAASFEKGFGFAISDTTRDLDAIPDDDFAKLMAAARAGLSRRKKIDNLVAGGNLDAASFLTGFGFAIGDTVALDELSDDDFAKMKSKATEARFAARPRREQVDIEMRLGNLDAAGFQEGFGFAIGDTAHDLDALSGDDFAEMMAAARALLPNAAKLRNARQLGNVDADVFEDVFGFAINDDQAIDDLPKVIFARWLGIVKSQTGAAEYKNLTNLEQLNWHLNLGNLNASSVELVFDVDMDNFEDIEVINGLERDEFRLLLRKACTAKFAALENSEQLAFFLRWPVGNQAHVDGAAFREAFIASVVGDDDGATERFPLAGGWFLARRDDDDGDFVFDRPRTGEYDPIQKDDAPEFVVNALSHTEFREVIVAARRIGYQKEYAKLPTSEKLDKKMLRFHLKSADLPSELKVSRDELDQLNDATLNAAVDVAVANSKRRRELEAKQKPKRQRRATRSMDGARVGERVGEGTPASNQASNQRRKEWKEGVGRAPWFSFNGVTGFDDCPGVVRRRGEPRVPFEPSSDGLNKAMKAHWEGGCDTCLGNALKIYTREAALPPNEPGNAEGRFFPQNKFVLKWLHDCDVGKKYAADRNYTLTPDTLKDWKEGKEIREDGEESDSMEWTS
jgi:hypothetical protein